MCATADPLNVQGCAEGWTFKPEIRRAIRLLANLWATGDDVNRVHGEFLARTLAQVTEAR